MESTGVIALKLGKLSFLIGYRFGTYILSKFNQFVSMHGVRIG